MKQLNVIHEQLPCFERKYILEANGTVTPLILYAETDFHSHIHGIEGKKMLPMFGNSEECQKSCRKRNMRK